MKKLENKKVVKKKEAKKSETELSRRICEQKKRKTSDYYLYRNRAWFYF